jgi:hypothetical protein
MNETGYSSSLWGLPITTASTNPVVISINTTTASTLYYHFVEPKIEKISEGFRSYLDGMKSLAKKLDLY